MWDYGKYLAMYKWCRVSDCQVINQPATTGTQDINNDSLLPNLRNSSILTGKVQWINPSLNFTRKFTRKEKFWVLLQDVFDDKSKCRFKGQLSEKFVDVAMDNGLTNLPSILLLHIQQLHQTQTYLLTKEIRTCNKKCQRRNWRSNCYYFLET